MQSESNPAGPVAVSYAGAAGTQMQNPGQVQVCILDVYMEHVISDVYK